MPGLARKLITVGISGVAAMTMAGCGASTPARPTAASHVAKHAATKRTSSGTKIKLHVRVISPPVHIVPTPKQNKTVSPPANRAHKGKDETKLTIHPLVISPPVNLLPPLHLQMDATVH